MDKICRYLDRELEEMENKVANGGKLSRTEIEDGKNIAKFKMALLTNEAMEKEGYSHDDRSYDGRSYGRPYYYDGMSGARRRDSMGRYSREAAEGEFMDKLEELRDTAPDEHKRKRVERFISEMK